MYYWLATAFLVIPFSANAHVVPHGIISTELAVSGSEIHLQTEVSPNISIYGYPLERQRQDDQNHFSKYFVITQGSSTCPFTLANTMPDFESEKSIFRGTFVCPNPIESPDDIATHNELFFDQFEKFEHYVTLFVGSERYLLSFSHDDKDFPNTVVAQHLGGIFDYFVVVTIDFIRSGVEHIWFGYDHVLFLLSIILLARNIRQILFLVTAFTLAHSVTLILAGFGIITLPTRVVEPAIAATILYMAVRNIQALKSGADAYMGERLPLVFAFGLVHGLGFAGALSETTIPQIFFVPALITFNVGIELGQLAILAVALPVLFYLDRLPWRTPILKVFSYVVAALALVWLLIRIFF